MAAKNMPKDEQFFFEGFSSPNGTFVPDDVFDVLAPRLTEAELRVLLYIVRRTFGFGKSADAISLKQLTDGIKARDGRILDYGTGMSRKGVIGGIKGLLAKGVIEVFRRWDDRGQNFVNVYALRFKDGAWPYATSRNGNNPEGSPPENPSPPVSGNNPENPAAGAALDFPRRKGLPSLYKTQTRPDVNASNERLKKAVTLGNYPCNPNTLPVGTQSSPQESVPQESARQEQQQQPPPAQSSSLGPPGAPVSAVVVSAPADSRNERPDLYERLRDLGVHQHTASKLLREHPAEHIEQMICYVTKRLQQGWAPYESVAAWLVAAIRGKYQLPESFWAAQEQEEREAEKQKAQEQLAAAVCEREQKRAEEELRRQRAGRLLSLGIEQNVDEMWQEAQARLRERGQWSAAMALCFLKNIENGLAVLLVPGNLRSRLAARQPYLEAVLAEIWGQPVRLVLHDLG